MNINDKRPAIKNVSQIDQRWNIRQSLDLEISLYRNEMDNADKNEVNAVNDGFISAHTGNISMGGMFINTPLTQFTVDDMLSASFTLQTQEGMSHHHMPVRVVRTTSRGAALVFMDYNIDTIHLLREILYEGAVKH
ncbi:MAG: PilZ domain-containing protein [Ectothiorhodospiraceae bacterium]|nr:PilZ domain-containing protein [Ectothiorhodospiraceae bacterium]